MRVRLNPIIAADVHQLAIRHNRTDQAMCEQILKTGIRNLTGAPDDDGAVDAVAYAVVKELADARGCSSREMIRTLVRSGLESHGVQMPERADAAEVKHLVSVLRAPADA